jgi:hypothetical protein
MNKLLFNLLALQDVDMKIRALKARLAMLPAERAANEKKLVAVSAALKARQDQLKTTEVAIRTAESEIARLNDNVQKLQVNSVLVKKNNEYQAMLTEIQHNKDKISDHETKLLELMETADAQCQQVKTEEKQSAARIQSIKDELQEFTSLEKEIKEQGRTLVAKSKDFASRVESSLLERYTRLLKDSGTPAVKLDGEICGNCRSKVTPQTRNACRSGMIPNCDNCSHMLYCDTGNE